jgi:hypothetical protein
VWKPFVQIQVKNVLTSKENKLSIIPVFELRDTLRKTLHYVEKLTPDDYNYNKSNCIPDSGICR